MCSTMPALFQPDGTTGLCQASSSRPATTDRTEERWYSRQASTSRRMSLSVIVSSSLVALVRVGTCEQRLTHRPAGRSAVRPPQRHLNQARLDQFPAVEEGGDLRVAAQGHRE